MKIKAHIGGLLRNTVLSLLFLALGVGLAFVTQHFWHVAWYYTFACVAGLLGLSFVYNLISTLRSQVVLSEDTITLTSGLSSANTISYRVISTCVVSPSRIDELFGFYRVTIQWYDVMGKEQPYVICLSRSNAQVLIDALEEHQKNKGEENE